MELRTTTTAPPIRTTAPTTIHRAFMLNYPSESRFRGERNEPNLPIASLRVVVGDGSNFRIQHPEASYSCVAVEALNALDSCNNSKNELCSFHGI
jgi:hypothetical protein